MALRGAPAGLGQRGLQSLSVGKRFGGSGPALCREVCGCLSPTPSLARWGGLSPSPSLARWGGLSLFPPPTSACSRGLLPGAAATNLLTHCLLTTRDHVMGHMTI